MIESDGIEVDGLLPLIVCFDMAEEENFAIIDLGSTVGLCIPF